MGTAHLYVRYVHLEKQCITKLYLFAIATHAECHRSDAAVDEQI